MIVSNSSCLIILKRLGKMELLEKLYRRVTIPNAVKNEVFKSGVIPDWIETVKIKQPIAPIILEKSLGKGESEAISISLELNAELLIIDDLAARKVANELGIKFSGVIGVLLEAKRRGLIPGIKVLLDEMMRQDFRISKTVYDTAVKIAKENQ